MYTFKFIFIYQLRIHVFCYNVFVCIFTTEINKSKQIKSARISVFVDQFSPKFKYGTAPDTICGYNTHWKTLEKRLQWQRDAFIIHPTCIGFAYNEQCPLCYNFYLLRIVPRLAYQAPAWRAH